MLKEVLLNSSRVSSLTLILLFSVSALAEESPIIEGWKPSSKPAIYNRQNVWDAINGAADIYLDYGLKELLLQRYKKGDREIEIEVYDQGMGINAFGIFKREKPPTAASQPIGGEAALEEPYTCMMYQGSYLVRVKALAGGLNEKECSEILKSLAMNLKGAKGSPEELRVLPREGMVDGTLGYTPNNFLGITDLPNALHATYQGCGDETCELFTIAELDTKKVDSVWRALSEKWKHNARSGYCILQREIPYRGPVVVVRKGNRIWGASGKGELKAISDWLEKTLGLLN